MAKRRREQDIQNEPGVAGKVADNPQQSHPSDQTADFEGINQVDNVNKKPDEGGGFTPDGAETAEPMYEALEGGDDYLEAILAKLEELERRLSDIEGVGTEGFDDVVEEEPMMEEPMMEEPTNQPMMEDPYQEKRNQRKRIESRAKKVFTAKRKVERRMTRRISTVPVGSSRMGKHNLKEFLSEVGTESRRL